MPARGNRLLPELELNISDLFGHFPRDDLGEIFPELVHIDPAARQIVETGIAAVIDGFQR